MRRLPPADHHRLALNLVGNVDGHVLAPHRCALQVERSPERAAGVTAKR